MPRSHPPSELTRRGFLQAAGAGTAVTLGIDPALRADAPGLPHKTLGRTGVRVPVLGLGTAPAGFRPQREAVAFYHHCIDRGVNYLDAAPEFTGYGKAQQYLGHVLRERRKEVFLVTKCFEPDGEKALALLKRNLKELQVDRADLVYAHSIGDDKMAPERIYAPGGVCKALEKARRDGLTRFLGVSGHNRPGRFLTALKEWDFDVMMNAVSLVARHIYDFERSVWPTAARKNVGLAAMKVFGGMTGSGPAAKGSRLGADYRHAGLRYALGLPHVAVVVLGMYDQAELEQNLAWVRGFQPLGPAELHDLDGPTRLLARQWGNVYGEVH